MKNQKKSQQMMDLAAAKFSGIYAEDTSSEIARIAEPPQPQTPQSTARYYSFLTTSETIAKLQAVARSENATMKALMEWIFSDFFDRYEKQYGKIQVLQNTRKNKKSLDLKI